MAAAATTSLNLTTTIFTIVTLFLLLNVQIAAFSSYDIEDTDDDHEVYVLDNPVSSLRTRSRFLASIIKKGTHCDPARSVCNGVSANNGTSLLYCCKTHCRNVRSDRNNCGRCGNKCSYGERCCNGVCTSIAYNDNHCGKCNNKCPSGLKCEYGTCGYA